MRSRTHSPATRARGSARRIEERSIATSETKIQEEIRELTRAEGEALLPELSEGSMRPKVESALAFGGETLITNFDALESALAGGAGTRIA